MKRVYIAGAIRAPNLWKREQNIRRAEEAAIAVAELGCTPFCPHSMGRFFDHALPEEFWLKADLKWLSVSDAIVVVEPGWFESQGTQLEMAYAKEHNIPRFFWTPHSGISPQFIEWIKGQGDDIESERLKDFAEEHLCDRSLTIRHRIQ